MSGVLLDTCAIIWTFGNDPISPLGRAAIEAAVDSDAAFVSAVSAWELGMLASEDRKRPLRLAASPEAVFDAILALPGMQGLALDYRCAVRSTQLPAPLHRDPADRMLIATARDHGLTLITRDQKILDYAARGHVRAIAC